MHLLKKITLMAIAVFSIVSLFAQKMDSIPHAGKNNIIKLNLSALVFKNISVQYERKIAKRSSLSVNVHMIPFGIVPLKSALEKLIDDPSVDLNKLKLGSFGITPEYRLYVGKRGALRGFYFGPFLSYTNYKTDLPLSYDNDTKTGIFSGKLNTLTFGLQLGAQWQLGKNVYFDWWILGPNYGSSSGDLVLKAALSQGDQDDLKTSLEDFKNSAPLSVVKSYQVDANGASLTAKGPWAGLRGLGFNIGIRF